MAMAKNQSECYLIYIYPFQTYQNTYPIINMKSKGCKSSVKAGGKTKKWKIKQKYPSYPSVAQQKPRCQGKYPNDDQQTQG